MVAPLPPLRQDHRSLQEMQIATLHFASLCEHHLLPFHGRAQICILSGVNGVTPSLAHLQTLVNVFGQRLQVQERLTQQIAEELHKSTAGVGVLVVCEAVHMCMVARGVEQHASSTVTVAARGCFSQDAGLRKQILRKIGLNSRTSCPCSHQV
eukprot:jgi/Botrbrau1/22597/Bobra.176_1s0027.1